MLHETPALAVEILAFMKAKAIPSCFGGMSFFCEDFERAEAGLLSLGSSETIVQVI